MELRCRKGDLAFILKSENGNEGKICEVHEFYAERMLNWEIVQNVWRITIGGEERNPLTGILWGARDCNLIPIRPDELKEETEKEVTA